MAAVVIGKEDDFGQALGLGRGRTGFAHNKINIKLKAFARRSIE